VFHSFIHSLILQLGLAVAVTYRARLAHSHAAYKFTYQRHTGKHSITLQRPSLPNALSLVTTPTLHGIRKVLGLLSFRPVLRQVVCKQHRVAKCGQGEPGI
jgi:hypothetical protein